MEIKTLYWDIETSPIITKEYKWEVYDERAIKQVVVEDRQILTVAWQMEGEKKIHCVGQDDFKGYKPGVNNDTEIVKFLWNLLDGVDISVAHNGDPFDAAIARARMIIRGLPPPTPNKQMDTKKMSKVFKFRSRKLKDIAQDLGLHQKGDPGGFDTWLGCLDGDKKAWKHMKKYNKADIPPLRDMYLAFRPWNKNVPPLNTMLDRPEACPKCGADSPIRTSSRAATTHKMYYYWRCGVCKGIIRQRTPEDSYAKNLYV